MKYSILKSTLFSKFPYLIKGKSNIVLITLYSLLSIFLLTACGAESDSASSDKDDLDAVPNNIIELSVQSTNPPTSAIDIEVDQIIAVTFSEAVNPDSITDLSYFITAPTGEVEGNINVDGSNIEFVPNKPFLHDSEYEVTLTSEIKSVDNIETSLPENYRFNFTTRSPWTYLLGSSSLEVGEGVATDSNDNVYVTGYTLGSINGGTSSGGYDIFISKYSTKGTLEWIRQFGTQAYDRAHGIAIDNDDNVYITGDTGGSLDGNTIYGNNDFFIAKYNSEGEKIWISQYGSSASDYGLGISLDVNGNVYVTGYTEGDLEGHTSLGDRDIFITKYNSLGVKQWIIQTGTSSGDYGRSVDIDSHGNVYVVGDTGGVIDGAIEYGSSDIILIKYDTNGTQMWSRQWGSTKYDNGIGVTIDLNDNIYAAGSGKGDIDGQDSLGSNDIFLKKYDSDGIEQWARRWGSTETDLARGIASDSNGYVYVTGYTYGEMGGKSSKGWWDLFITQYDPSGTQQWTQQLGSSGGDYAFGVSTDKNNDVYITGSTTGKLSGIMNSGSEDVLIAKYNSSGDKK